MPRCLTLLVVLYCALRTQSSRIRIDKNGYKDILVALPSDGDEEERPRIVRRLEDMLRSSSVLLQMATKGRAHFSEVSFLTPRDWKISDDDAAWKSTSFNATAFSNPRAALTADAADVIVTGHGQYPYVLHQGGCGRQARRIILPKDFLIRTAEIGSVFFRLWSEYRYGVFPEGGFQNDEKYPTTYRASDGTEKKTGCSDKTYWSSNLCDEDDKQCIDNSFTSSVMDQHLSSSASLFCEGSVSLGPRHNSESPSKHNLICREEGTWFTVMRSEDFSRGRNAAPKYLRHATNVAFRFVQEAAFPRVVVAIEVSSRMKNQNRFILSQAAFYQYVYSTLPYGTEVTLLVFGGDGGPVVAKQPTVLKSEDSRILYVETQPLPDDVSDADDVSLEHLFDLIFQLEEDSDDVRKKASPDVIVLTTETRLNSSSYETTKGKILESGSLLHVLMFPGYEGEPTMSSAAHQRSLLDLCFETGGQFTAVHSFGDIARAFGKSIKSPHEEILILENYLKQGDDDMDLEIPFVLDQSLPENLKVSLSFPYTDRDPLQYKKTILQTPSGSFLNFMKLDFVFAWMVDLTKPEAGEYVLRTRQVDGVSDPVIITVAGRPSESEDPVTVDVWSETLTEFEAMPRPVRIYAEVRKGWNPVRGAQVVATVRHPDGQVTRLILLDDGLGDVDMTKDDGIYGRYFTNFTAPGFYNVYVQVTHGFNATEVLKGPYGFCCGSSFSAVTTLPVGPFLREAGPSTFLVPFSEGDAPEDRYPPSRVTDLRLHEKYDRICILHWTAVGDDYDSGFAEAYELKVFREPSIIRNRFSGSGQELYSEVIGATPEATYGTILNHAFEIPRNLKGSMFYVAVRAVDEAGNAGEPSNVVTVWMEEEVSPTITDCEGRHDSCDDCQELPRAEEFLGDSARNIVSSVLNSIAIPILSLFLFYF